MQVNYAIYQAAKEAAAIGTKRSGGRKRKSTEPAEPPALPAMTSPEEMDALKQLFAEKTSPVTIAKAIKNEAELQGMREAHLRDGVALAKLFHGLEKQVSACLSECSIFSMKWQSQGCLCCVVRPSTIGTQASAIWTQATSSRKVLTGLCRCNVADEKKHSLAFTCCIVSVQLSDSASRAHIMALDSSLTD